MQRHNAGWFHAQLWCYGQWLPGDERGFRSAGHKVHSSGDYKRRPPAGEHAGLKRHAQRQLADPPVALSPAQRPIVAGLVLRWCEMKAVRLVALAVGGQHTHLFIELPLGQVDRTIGKLKRYVSVEASKADPAIPSKLFARKGEPKPVRSAGHARQLFPYITVKHAREGAWVRGDEALLAVATKELGG